MTWLYLALLAPLLYAVVNIFDDNLLRHVYKSPQAAIVVTGLFGVVPALLILLLGLNRHSLPPHLIGLTMASGFMATVGTYYYLRGLKIEDPSVVAALFSLTPAIVPFFAHYFVGEHLSQQAILGFSIVIVAGFLYSLTDIRKITISKALLLILLSSALYDAASLLGKYAYERVDFYSAYLYVSWGMAVAGLVFFGLWHRGRRGAIKAARGNVSLKVVLLLAIVELLSLAAIFASSKAISQGPVSLVLALENLQPLYVLLIAVGLYPFYPKYFREAESRRFASKIVLCLLLVGGVYIAVS